MAARLLPRKMIRPLLVMAKSYTTVTPASAHSEIAFPFTTVAKAVSRSLVIRWFDYASSTRSSFVLTAGGPPRESYLCSGRIVCCVTILLFIQTEVVIFKMKFPRLRSALVLGGASAGTCSDQGSSRCFTAQTF